MHRLIPRVFVLLVSGCGLYPKRLAIYEPPIRDSVIESARRHTEADVAAEEDTTYRSWLRAQRSGVCEVHNAKMRRMWLPIQYGLPDESRLPSANESARFPYGLDFWPGGCVVSRTKEMEVFVCRHCTVEFQRWKKRNPKPNQSSQRNAMAWPISVCESRSSRG